MVATNIQTRKMELISLIITLEQDADVAAFERVVPSVKKAVEKPKKRMENAAYLAHYVRPTRENITIEELMREQHSTPIDKAKMDEIVKAMDIQEPIEVLLAQLTP